MSAVMGQSGLAMLDLRFLVEVREPAPFPLVGCVWRQHGGRPFVNAQAANTYAAGLRGSGAAHVRVRPVRL